MQGASPASSQYLPVSFTPDSQQDSAPPGLLEQPDPPHSPQLVGQQTALVMIPTTSPVQIGPVWCVVCRYSTGDGQDIKSSTGWPRSKLSSAVSVARKAKETPPHTTGRPATRTNAQRSSRHTQSDGKKPTENLGLGVETRDEHLPPTTYGT